MMKYSVFIIISGLILFTNCKHTPREIRKPPIEATPSTGAFESRFIKKHTTENYSFHIEAENGEVTSLSVYTKGMEHDFNESMTIEGQIIESYMLDINNDGYKEFYLFVKPTDDSGNIDIMGFGSNKGQSISFISIAEKSELRDVNSDKLTVTNNNIIRTYTSNGQSQSNTYILSEGEASYILQAQ